MFQPKHIVMKTAFPAYFVTTFCWMKTNDGLPRLSCREIAVHVTYGLRRQLPANEIRRLNMNATRSVVIVAYGLQAATRE